MQKTLAGLTLLCLLGTGLVRGNNSHICFLPVSKGECVGFFNRWASVGGRCEQFRYTGCASNSNNFLTKEECETACPPTVASVPVPVCQQDLLTGSCPDGTQAHFVERWGSLAGVCGQFIYSGCGGNSNNFLTLDECKSACPSNGVTVFPEVQAAEPIIPSQPTAANVCSLPIKYGRRCNRRTSKAWGSRNGRCVKFTHRGCGGNKNRFKSKLACERKCGNGGALNGEKNTRCGHTAADETRGCSRRMLVKKFYYDEDSNSCSQSLGCKGNRTGFRLEKGCESMCKD